MEEKNNLIDDGYKEAVIGTGNLKVCIYDKDNATPNCLVNVPKVILSVRKTEKQ